MKIHIFYEATHKMSFFSSLKRFRSLKFFKFMNFFPKKKVTLIKIREIHAAIYRESEEN